MIETSTPFVEQNPSTGEPREGLADDERWQLAQRIARSGPFSKSQRLSNLLLYLAEQTLLGKAQQLTEQKIASEVFQRPTGFDPTMDTIVRSHMVRLRQKIDQYSNDQGKDENLRLSIPKGGYTVSFEKTGVPNLPREDAIPLVLVEPQQEPSEGDSKERPLRLACIGLSLLCVILGTLLIFALRSPQSLPRVLARKHPLWSTLIQPNQKLTFVAADSSFVLLNRFVHDPQVQTGLKLAQYMNHDYEQQTRGLSPEMVDHVLSIAAKRYTSYVDLTMLHRLESLPMVRPGDVTVRYARDLHISDLKEGNLILSGAREANPWLELFEPEMNFFKDADPKNHMIGFTNRHPRPGEETIYATSTAGTEQRVLGVLALLPNLNGTGKVLIMEGTTLPGTEAISDFAFDDTELLPFLEKIKRPDGTLPYFEVLLESRDFNDTSGRFHILTYRVH